ncbi:MAG: [LysW]-lysine hydrolase [Herpetosiphonaceae bacterium]|nr:[LysW]-lysine hydrolase [Herpetosiphonaceae bacterium]
MQLEVPPLAVSQLSDAAAVDLLHRLVALPSVSGREHDAVHYLVDVMQRLGFEAYVDQTGNAVGHIGQGRPEVVLLGHIDTVPGSVPVRIEDGKLYGRGAVDAKGPLAAFVAAAARCGAVASGGRVTVIGCVEEEAPSSRGAHGVLDAYRPDYCIVGEPSGTGAITVGYKGSLRARIHLSQPSGHSAHDRLTVAEQGSDLWQQLRRWSARINVGRERSWDQLIPALVGIRSGSDGLQDWCELELSIRLPEDIGPSAAAAWLRELVGEGSLEILGGVDAFRTSRSSPVARALIGGFKREGLVPRFIVKTGTSDMNLVGLAWGCPIITYGPGDASLDHTPDEHILLADYLRSIRVLEHTLTALLAASAV